MNKPFDKKPGQESESIDNPIARLMGLGERSVQKSYYPQLQKKIQELEASEHRYRLLAENISDVIWMLELDFSIAYISPSIERMSGFSPQELEGRPFLRLFTPEHSALFEKTISEAIKKQSARKDNVHETIELELEQINKDGTISWVEAKVSCCSDSGTEEKRILGISRNITARKRIEQEKEAMQAQLFQAQKMDSVGTLAGGIAHDFNNLLTVINGYADLAIRKINTDNPLFKNISVIKQAGQKAENLTRQLLAFSRQQIYRPVPININDIISSMDSLLRRLIGEDIIVKTSLGLDLDSISADQTQIEQIFTNLVVNARDALNEIQRENFKKRLTIETGQAMFSLSDAKSMGLDLGGKYIFFCVSDNGMGIAPDIQKRIFEPFFTTKSKSKGTGLGLSMIYGIVKQNKGNIQVYSEPGQGSVFKIYWPATADPSCLKTDDTKDIDLLCGHEKIMIVEDDKEVCNFAASALDLLGYVTDKAFNGRQALEKIENFIQSGKPAPNLVVTDLIMPEMNGKEFIKKALGLVPGLKVIYVSGYTDSHIVHDSILEDGVNFLQKPYSQHDLAKMVRNVLDNDHKT